MTGVGVYIVDMREVVEEREGKGVEGKKREKGSYDCGREGNKRKKQESVAMKR